MEINKGELHNRTVWRKYLLHSQGEGFFSEESFAKLICVREVSGYAVWYCRSLRKSPADAAADGNYLLRFFAPQSKHLAIEFAVIASRPGASPDEAIAALDAEVANAMRLETPEEVKPVAEQIS